MCVGEKAQHRMLGLGPNLNVTSCPKRLKGSTLCHLGENATKKGRVLCPKTTWPVRRGPIQRISRGPDQADTLKISL